MSKKEKIEVGEVYTGYTTDNTVIVFENPNPTFNDGVPSEKFVGLVGNGAGYFTLKLFDEKGICSSSSRDDLNLKDEKSEDKIQNFIDNNS